MSCAWANELELSDSPEKIPSITRWKQAESWVLTNSMAGAKSFWIASDVPVNNVENNDTPNISSIPPRFFENSFSCQLVENESHTTYNARQIHPLTFSKVENFNFFSLQVMIQYKKTPRSTWPKISALKVSLANMKTMHPRHSMNAMIQSITPNDFLLINLFMTITGKTLAPPSAIVTVTNESNFRCDYFFSFRFW